MATYLDDVPLVGAVQALVRPDPSLYDVERVEVSRGPQGTLFGSGSLGGAVRIITKKPEFNKFDASYGVDLGQTGSDSFRQRYNAVVNVPLVDDRLAMRAVGYVRDEDGYIDNVGTGIRNSNSNTLWGGRFYLKAALTDQLTSIASVTHQSSEPKDNFFVDPSLGENKRFT